MFATFIATFIIIYISIGIIFNACILLNKKINEEIFKMIKEVYEKEGMEITKYLIAIGYISYSIGNVLFWPFRIKITFNFRIKITFN
mgnify:CR=1 FL=1